MGRGKGKNSKTATTGGNTTNTGNTGSTKPNTSNPPASSSNANTIASASKSKAKPPATQNICIRCPDLPTAIQNMHPSHDFNPCFATYTTPPDGTYAVSTLWWGFSDGVIGENMTLADMNISSFDACSKMLKAAKAVGADAKYKSLADFGVESNLRNVKSTLQWEEKVISKEALEAAMKVGRQQNEFKDQQNDMKVMGVGLNGGHKKIEDVVFGRSAAGDVQDGSQAGGASGSSGGAQEGGLADSGQASGSGHVSGSGQASGGGQASGSGQAGMAGGGGGSGSSANTTQGTINLASRPKGKGPADPATASAGTPVTTTSTPPVCPRCPVGCPFKNLHVDLLVCFDDVLLLDKEKALKVLWPNITTEDNIASLVEGFDPCGLLSGGEKKVDHEVIAVMVQGLQAGEAAYDGVPFTKALAETTLVEYHKRQRKPTAPPQRNLERSFLPPPKVRKLEKRDEKALLTPNVQVSKHEAVYQHGVSVPFTPAPGTDDIRYALRDAFGTEGSPIEVYTNHFEVQLPKGLVLYEYQVVGTSPDWETATRNKRKVFMRDAIDNLPELKERATVIATDYYDKIIAGRKLLDDDEPAEVLVYNYKPGTRDEPETLTLKVTFICEYSMDMLLDNVHGRNVGYAERGAAEALNMIMSKAVADGADDVFMAGNNKFFYRPGVQDLGGKRGLVAMRGYYSSVRPAMGAVTLNINTLTSAFYRQQTIAQYLAGLRGGDEMGQKYIRLANKHLKGLRAYVNFSRAEANKDATLDDVTRRIKTICELKDFANKVPFKPSSTEDATTVAKHLLKKHHDDSKGADKAVAVNVGAKAPNEKFYLDSQLLVLSDQMFRKRLDGTETTKMLEIAQREPAANRSAILHEGLQSLSLGVKSQKPDILEELKIKVGTDMMLLPARALSRPQVVYKGQKTAVFTKHRWTTRDRDFFDTKNRFSATKNANVAFLCVSDTNVPTAGYRRLFQQAFMKWHDKNGLQQLTTITKADPIELSSDAFLSAESMAVELRAYKNADLVVLMLPYKNGDCAARHAVFKTAADQLVGVKSAVMCENTMLTSVGDKDLNVGTLAAYMGNYAMKLNLRLGNVNHVLDPQALFPLAPSNAQAELDCMILGADVTHPSNTSTKGTPSVAAVVGSMDRQFAAYSGQMRINGSKDEPIKEMVDMSYRLFQEWAVRNGGRLPQRILLYRDGVSESQYHMVRNDEVEDIRKGWRKAWANLKNIEDQMMIEPEVTAVIVVKRHHTRLYPKNSSSINGTKGNCPPGTTVDTSITSPYYLDFFLQSHDALIGTGKPAHYFVVENGIGLTSEQLQTLTNNICYLYGRSTTAVSYASPAYYADRLCERGRQYLKPFFDPPDDASDAADAAGGRSEAERAWDRGDYNDGNPWSPKLNGTMFWM
ncbi:hypothetical protein LTS10_005120 [Elasticomyces elasticus]|nr:hypothetical protein LTS10_005120 [Elasticomyces elasticus]